MLGNLREEMTNRGITILDISSFLGVRYMTVCDKLNGNFDFRISEAFKIKNEFFPDLSIEYLFGGGDRNKTA